MELSVQEYQYLVSEITRETGAKRDGSGKNPVSYTHLMLRQGVTTLIFGDNRDNESQQSNGAGKSALLECIAVEMCIRDRTYTVE